MFVIETLYNRDGGKAENGEDCGDDGGWGWGGVCVFVVTVHWPRP